ncbi:major facilitator superfamily domain-containing protein [Dactylonectria macrodidyma]|uniref:Major facilitator superfamily domain-containing protein n=1 Tax=Dactylonectria macrodidyma TaxID=307937 RepID=A0A9P9FFJ9_9HYPO|nr:major facilitator superfamily domain-containing protein [Dactylonectria macrodidyma]
MASLWQQGGTQPGHQNPSCPPTVAGTESVLGQGRKYSILFIVSWNTLVVTFSSTSLLVATPEIAASLKTTSQILNVTNAGVLVAMGCSSMIWSPLAEILSRRHSYNAAIIVMVASSIGTALAPNMVTFTATRVLSGLTGTYFMVAGQTIIADIFNPLVRGRAVGCMQVGSVAGTAIGPCISGVIVTFSHWRSIYYLQVAMSAFGLVLSIIFIPSIRCEVDQLHGEVSRENLSVFEIIKRFDPTKILKQFFRPQVFLADLTCGFLAVSQYGLLTSVRSIVNPRFHLKTPLVSGLFYIAPGMGFIAGSIIGGHFSDRTVKYYLAKREGMRLPKDRLNSGLVYMLIILPISLLLYGWGLEKKFGGLALPIIMAFWIGVGLLGAWNGLNTYTAEVFPAERSEVVCSKYILQYIFGAASTAAIIPLLETVGVGWGFTICK